MSSKTGLAASVKREKSSKMLAVKNQANRLMSHASPSARIKAPKGLSTVVDASPAVPRIKAPKDLHEGAAFKVSTAATRRPYFAAFGSSPRSASKKQKQEEEDSEDEDEEDEEAKDEQSDEITEDDDLNHCTTQLIAVEPNIINDTVMTARTAGLTVSTTANNVPLIWGPDRRHQLSWSIDPQLAAKKQSLRPQLQEAFSSWAQACGVSFIPLSNDTGFIRVREANDKEKKDPLFKGTIAYTFFPGEPVRHFVLFPAYFTYRNQVGVLRHEIGHILGFRHEHIWEDRGNNFDEPVVVVKEDGSMVMGAENLTPGIDRESIMHYGKIHADNAARHTTDLSKYDKIGARLLYGASSTDANYLII